MITHSVLSLLCAGAILGKLYKIPGTCSNLCCLICEIQFINNASQLMHGVFAELGGKDVEDLFTAVLSPATTQPAPLPQPPPPPQLMSLHSQGMFLCYF